MTEDLTATNTCGAVVRPPIALVLAFGAGVGLDWLHPLPFVPGSTPRAWPGGAIFVVGCALAVRAITTIRRAGSRVETYQPTTTIIADGP